MGAHMLLASHRFSRERRLAAVAQNLDTFANVAFGHELYDKATDQIYAVVRQHGDSEFCFEQIRLFSEVEPSERDYAALDSAICFAVGIGMRYPHLLFEKVWFSGFLDCFSHIVHSTTSAPLAEEEQFQAMESCLLIIYRSLDDADTDKEDFWIAFALGEH
jgi:hypothetical protein